MEDVFEKIEAGSIVRQNVDTGVDIVNNSKESTKSKKD